MKIKTFVILIIIAAALSAGGYGLIRFQAGHSSESVMGRPLFKEFPADRISLITIQGPQESVRLKKSGDQWVVQSRLNYPADFKKISELARKVKEARIGRVFESNQGSLERLALIDPAGKDDSRRDKGLRVIFQDEKGQEVKNILLGKSREPGEPGGPSEGQYLMLQGDSKIYLVDRDFSTLEAKSLEWLESELADIPAADIKDILCRSDEQKVRYHFARPEKGKAFEAVQFPAGKKVKNSALDQLSGALDTLRMENIVDPSTLTESPVKMSNLIEYHLYNGLIYRIRPGDTCAKDDSCYLKIEVAYQKPPALTEAKDDTTKETEKQKDEKAEASEDLSQEAVKLNEKFKPWTYIIPSWKKDTFITDVSGLVEETAGKKNN